MIKTGEVKPNNSALDEQIMERFIINKWANSGSKIKLRPVKNDKSALEKIVAGDKAEYDRTSNLTINYEYFCEENPETGNVRG